MRLKFLQLSIFGYKPARAFRKKAAPAKPRAPHSPQSDPALRRLWLDVRQRYFPQRPDIDDYVVVWSKRKQKRTLASCNLRTKRVVVAREMSQAECSQWLEPLLYHEMCHAILGLDITRDCGRRAWHGREFRALERRHPRIGDLDEWIKSGGWDAAKRRDRARRVWARRQAV